MCRFKSYLRSLSPIQQSGEKLHDLPKIHKNFFYMTLLFNTTRFQCQGVLNGLTVQES